MSAQGVPVGAATSANTHTYPLTVAFNCFSTFPKLLFTSTCEHLSLQSTLYSIANTLTHTHTRLVEKAIKVSSGTRFWGTRGEHVPNRGIEV